MSASCCAGSFSEVMAQRLQGSSFGRLPKLGRVPKSRHVRLHCIVTAKPLQKQTWQSAFGLGGSGRSFSQTKENPCLGSLPEGERSPSEYDSSTFLPASCAGKSTPGNLPLALLAQDGGDFGDRPISGSAVGLSPTQCNAGLVPYCS